MNVRMKSRVERGANAMRGPLEFALTPGEREKVRTLCKHSGSSESGVALVITLTLLSVITFMAVTFLVVSRSEQGSVGSATDQNTATLSADAGFEHAKMRL